jgi:hypothetical protein
MRSLYLHYIGSFEAAMSEGNKYLKVEDLVNARRCFVRAHALGHENISEHIRSHLSLLRIAWRERNILEYVSHLYSVVSLRLLGKFFFRSAE